MRAPTNTRRLAIFLALPALLLPLLGSPSIAGAQTAETLILFDPSAAETPESIVFDRRDNAYITMAFSGEIRKIAPDLTQSTLAFMPIGGPCGPVSVVALGLAIDRHDRLYVAVTACDPANSGIWKVDIATGAIELLANAPSFVVWNGIDVHKGFIYAADTFGGLVWRIPTTGGSPEIWADDPLLQIPPGSPFPGPNGLQYFRGRIYVANTSTGDIVRIPVRPNGGAGQPSVFASVFPFGCDEFTFDARGRLYCATDPFNTLARLSSDGSVETLLTAADLLDGPTSVAFGRRGRNKKNLYITNAAFPIFSTTFRPSLMRLRIEIPGAPAEY
jgi:sugar lactone lactonase YvrE